MRVETMTRVSCCARWYLAYVEMQEYRHQLTFHEDAVVDLQA